MGPFNTTTGYTIDNSYQQQLPTSTNKIFVTSLEIALSKACNFNSEMIYFDQNKPVFYVIKTDSIGRKEWAEIPYQLPNNISQPKNLEQKVEELLKRIEALEQPKKEVQHVESVQQPTIQQGTPEPV